MKHIFKIFKFFIPTIISVIVIFYILGKINFQFNNPNEIIGYYSLNNYSVLNDNFRYLIFIIFPSITFVVSFLFWKKRKLKDLKELFLITKCVNNQSKISLANLILIISLITFYILSLSFNYGAIDLFHDGQVLVGAKNFLLKENIFQENYIVTSLLIDILNPIISWKLFGIEGLTSYRLLIVFLNLISLIILILFLYHLINFSKIVNKNFKLLLFSFLSLLAIYFFRNGSFSFRDITLFLFFITALLMVNSNNKKILCFVIGVLPLLSLLISLDRGIFLLSVYFIYLLCLFLNNQYKNLFYIFN